MKAPAGYSRKPIAAKLGIKDGLRVGFLHEPAHYRSWLGAPLRDVHIVGPRASNLDVLQLFVRSRGELVRQFPRAKARIKLTGALWVSWPKQSSRLKGDLTGDHVRKIGLDHGLVDVKVCAVDEDWSALKFVYRVKDR